MIIGGGAMLGVAAGFFLFTKWTLDLLPRAPEHHSPVRVLPHITKLDDCFGDFLVRVTCPCGVSRHIEPEALARLAGRSATLAAWQSGCGARGAGRRSPK